MQLRVPARWHDMGLKYDQDRASSAHRTAMRGSRKLTGAGHVTQQRLTGAGDVAPTALTKWHWDVNSSAADVTIHTRHLGVVG